jgi:hypothetical protein
VLEDAVGALTLDRERVVPIRSRQGLLLEAAPLGVAGEHPVEVAGEQAGLLSAGAAADLHDHVLVVGRVGLDHGQPDLLLELAQAGLGAREHLAQLGVVAVLGHHLPRTLGVRVAVAPLERQRVGGLEGAVRPPHLGVAVAIGDHLGVRHLLRELREALLDLVHELLDHSGQKGCMPAGTG